VIFSVGAPELTGVENSKAENEQAGKCLQSPLMAESKAFPEGDIYSPEVTLLL
jgi:hypothetical protein